MEYILKVKGLTKKFEENYALKGIDFNLGKGEIHGIVGANGSGKSTFLNILFGSHYIEETGGYEGDIWIEGSKVKITNSYDAMNTGIGMVYQEFALLGNLNIGSNIKINRENTYPISKKLLGRDFALVDIKKNQKDANMALSKLGININTNLLVKELPINIKQFIEIARELDKDNLKILMLDEPTASLNQEDTKLLLEALKDIALKGTSIIFISHRLEEVTELCDRLTILRDGELVANYSRDEFDIDKIAIDMVGKQIVKALRKRNKTSKKDLMSFKNVEVDYGQQQLLDISLNVKEGEILGITGLAGHGQEIFGYGLMGLYPMRGEVIIDGDKIIPGDIPSMFSKGVYLLPDERKEMGLLLEEPIWKNMIFGTWGRKKSFLKNPKLKGMSFLNYDEIHNYTRNMVEDLNIKVSDIEQKVRELSGGNQQKVCIARAMTIEPRILFIGEPTRGIDIYSKELIIEMLLKMNEKKNMTIVISSGEIGELKRVCDRIVVMFEGKIFGIFDPDEKDEVFSLAISGRKFGSYEKV